MKNIMSFCVILMYVACNAPVNKQDLIGKYNNTREAIYYGIEISEDLSQIKFFSPGHFTMGEYDFDKDWTHYRTAEIKSINANTIVLHRFQADGIDGMHKSLELKATSASIEVPCEALWEIFIGEELLKRTNPCKNSMLIFER